MTDDVKKALEELEQTFVIVHRVATHQSDAAYMSIPADPKRDADLRHMAAVEALRAHIEAEPARLAAAREEQREACAQWAMRADVTWDTLSECGDAIRATPLTATPLADRIAELENERDHLKASLVTERKWHTEALARVKELEAYGKLADADAESEERRADALERERDSWKAQRNEVHAEMERQTAMKHEERQEKISAMRERDAALARVKELEVVLRRERDLFKETFFTPADKRAETAEAERDALKAQLAEAVGALRGLRDEVSAKLTGRDSEPGQFEKTWQTACAVLTKVKP